MFRLSFKEQCCSFCYFSFSAKLKDKGVSAKKWMKLGMPAWEGEASLGTSQCQQVRGLSNLSILIHDDGLFQRLEKPPQQLAVIHRNNSAMQSESSFLFI